MTTTEIAWITGLFQDLQQSYRKPVVLHCDNISTKHIAQNEVFHKRIKHLKHDCYYIRENIEVGIIFKARVKSSLQIAYVLTKSLTAAQHCFLSSKLGLVSVNQAQLAMGM